MPIYEIWQSVQSSEVSLFQSDALTEINLRWRLYIYDQDGKLMEPVASFWADDWEEAKKARNAIMGW